MKLIMSSNKIHFEFGERVDPQVGGRSLGTVYGTVYSLALQEAWGPISDVCDPITVLIKDGVILGWGTESPE